MRALHSKSEFHPTLWNGSHHSHHNSDQVSLSFVISHSPWSQSHGPWPAARPTSFLQHTYWKVELRACVLSLSIKIALRTA